jgi:hypothetical protein
VSARLAGAALIAALLAAALLVAVELGMGGLGYGALPSRDPCARHEGFPGGGLDATAQRVGLRGLDLAACRLGVTRESLLLGLAGRESVGAPPEEVERAVREGLASAIEEEDLDPVSEFALRQLVLHAPADWALSLAQRLGLLG